MNALQWINAAICLAVVVVTFFALVRMRKETELQILLAFPTMAAGMLGAVVGYFRPGDWQAACDTMLFGGVLALMIGSRKNPNWIEPRWIRPIAIGVLMATWGAFLMGVS